MKSALIFGLLGASLQLSSAHPTEYKNALRRRGLDLSAYRFKGSGQYHNHDQSKSDEGLKMLKRASYVETATELVKKVAPNADFRVVDDHYVGSSGIAHVNFTQQAHGIDILNSDFNVNIGPDGHVFSFSNGFFPEKVIEQNPFEKRSFAEPFIALKTVMRKLGLPIVGEALTEVLDDVEEAYYMTGLSGVVKDPEARLKYFKKPDGKLALTWEIETDIRRHWLHSYVDATTGKELYGVSDWVSMEAKPASYEVYEWGVANPDEGVRETLQDPWDLETSEFTWQSNGKKTFYTTEGNNARAMIDNSGNDGFMPKDKELTFEYPYSPNMTDPASYQEASLTQLFYTANKYHDLLHVLGFDEAAGNFEANNNGDGGNGGDPVILSAQDSFDTNNAAFSTPPDGMPGMMYMFLWDYTPIKRDCAFASDVVIHEYTHGLSNRLTGGPANANCLQQTESMGMGEGWSDFYALAVGLKPNDTRADDKTMGAWVMGDAKGLRSVPYSTDMKRNPNTYETLNGLNEEHDIGETWATVLFEVMWNLIDKHGKNDSDKPIFENGVPNDGKYLSMKIVMEGMALQPCNPNMVEARDAIIDADTALTDGDNICELWTAFAKRGLGEDAVYDEKNRVNSFKIPEGVC